MSDKWINRIAKLPEYLVTAIYLNKAVIFTGAGVSVQYGMPTWNGLANHLFDCTDKKVYKRQLGRKSYSAMERVTFAAKILDKDYKNKGRNEIVKVFSKEPNEKVERIAECLKTFDCPILTTNADKGIDKILEHSGYVVYDYFDEKFSKLPDRSITHIHGSIDAPDKMVFTAKDYLKNYHKDGIICENLHTVFNSDKVFLFIGYGAREFEFLRQILEQYGKDENPKYYILKEYYADQKISYEIEQEYFADFGFEIIPYLIQKGDYRSFLDTLDHWKEQINQYSIFKSEMELKERLSTSPNQDSIDYVLEQFKIPERERTIYEILYKSHYLKKWIECLYEQNI